MSVRAKFRVVRIEASQATRVKPGQDTLPYNQRETEAVELRTVVLHPIYHNGDPNHENTKFWEASPSGEIKLGTVNPAAWEQFVLGHDFYIDFIEAPPAE